MELSIKQSNKFIEWYIDRYAKKDSNGKPITPVDIPNVQVSKQREDMLAWADIIYDVLGRTKANQTYKYRVDADGKKKRETLFEKALHSLFLQYGPTYIEEDGSVAIKPLWWDDVINVKDFLKTKSGKIKK